jgi:hypothetical protein
MTDQAKHYSLRLHEGKALFVLGDVVTFKLSAAETNSAYSLIEIISVPGGGPAFLHTHGPQETFWILEGDYEIYGQDENAKKYAIPASAGARYMYGGMCRMASAMSERRWVKFWRCMNRQPTCWISSTRLACR